MAGPAGLGDILPTGGEHDLGKCSRMGSFIRPYRMAVLPNLLLPNIEMKGA